MPILAKGQRAAPQAHSALFGQPLKCSRLPGLGTVDQLALVVFGCVHYTGDSPVPAKRFTCEKIFLRIPATRTLAWPWQ